VSPSTPAARASPCVPAPGAESSTAKGAAVRSTIAFLESRFGDDMVVRVLGTLSPNESGTLRSVGPTDEVPYPVLVALWKAADALVRRSAPDWAQESGAFSIESGGMQLYGGILRKATPQAFLTGSVSLFRLYYHPGDMEVVEDEQQRAVLRLVGFEPLTPLFCLRQTGGLRRAIEIAGGVAARVRHVRCCIEGDAFCEWELHWQLESVKPATG
jgi:hypothetical protein